MLTLEPLLDREAPDAVVVAGDANSTMAAAVTAAKIDLPVVHLEAGLRSGDRSMPEEVNRIVADHVADLLLTPSGTPTRTCSQKASMSTRFDSSGTQ
jgi:UDP-N-acetylglucosamine 2-epimerase (non-hydrolysing)